MGREAHNDMKAVIIGFVLGLCLIAASAFAGNRGLRLGQVISGDTNCDGRVFATDALATLRIATGFDPELTVREVCKP